MITNKEVAKSTLSKIAEAPETFGGLNGKTGIFASRTERQDRQQAELNAGGLARELERYLRLRSEAEHRYETEERAARLKIAIDIPALSADAKGVLERVRDAIDRNDLPAALEFALEDKMIEAELEGFAKAVDERFGERTFLTLAAKDADGRTFAELSAGMTADQRQELAAAWPDLRTTQQLAAGQRTTQALREAETMRQSQRQGLSLK